MGALYVLHEDQGTWGISFYNALGAFLFGSPFNFRSEVEAKQEAERLLGRMK